MNYWEKAIQNRHLEVGIARPMAIYVLYPWHGKLVLCKGAVMPYYEFANNTRLTDAEWKVILDSEQRPDVPEWIKIFFSDDTDSPPSIEP